MEEAYGSSPTVHMSNRSLRHMTSPGRLRRGQYMARSGHVTKHHYQQNEMLSEPDELDKIKNLIVTAGDKGGAKLLPGVLKALQPAVMDQLNSNPSTVQSILIDCAMHLPTKVGVYGAFVGLLNTTSPSFVESLLETTVNRLVTCLRESSCCKSQQLLRFLVELSCSNVVEIESLLSVIDHLIRVACSLKPCNGGDLGTFVVLSALPWLSVEAHSQYESRVDAILDHAQEFMMAREVKYKAAVEPLHGEQPLPDRLESLFKAIVDMKTQKWQSRAVHRVAPLLSDSLTDAVAHRLPSLSVGPEDMERTSFIPGIVLQLPGSVSDSESPLSSFDRWIVEDLILIIIDGFYVSLKECANQLLRIAVRSDQFEWILIEVIFSQLLKLTDSRQTPFFYVRLLQTIASLQHSCKPVIDRTFDFLAKRVVDLDEIAFDRLSEFLSYHLSTVRLEWEGWELWTKYRPPEQLQRFLKRTMERLQRLCFRGILITRLPGSLRSYMPPEPEPSHPYKTSKSAATAEPPPELMDLTDLIVGKDSNPLKLRMYLQEMMELPRAKKKKEEILKDDVKKNENIEDLNELYDPEDDDQDINVHDVEEEEEEEEDRAWRRRDVGDGQKECEKKQSRRNSRGDGQTLSLVEIIELLTIALLDKGSRTITHTSKLLDLYVGCFDFALDKLDVDETRKLGEKNIMSVIWRFWKNNSIRIETSVNDFLNQRLISAVSIVQFILLDVPLEELDNIHNWALITTVVNKVFQHSVDAEDQFFVAENRLMVRSAFNILGFRVN
eukprot:GHVL01023270.1.p1 GENE.GHVL01023270.1~~GHVL01023270.1.p1  ORF type:complete len:779 (+),score=118.59 GHVL01023270.1:54-2390(+)